MADHLNLFEPYSQGNDNPKENNLSRGIAILLEENYLLFDRFIDVLNSGLNKNNHAPIVKPCSPQERIIDIQSSASTLAASEYLEGVQRIIPVTLTPEKTESGDEIRDQRNPIPDISIYCCNDDNADLIIIEVKQYQLNADAQVLNQAERIERSIKDNVEDSEVFIVRDVIHITWRDIIGIIQDIQRLQEGRSDFVLNHYLEYLKTHRQSWFPVEPFRAGMTDEMMWQRIWPLANNCANLLGENSIGKNPWSYRIFLENSSWGYMQEIQIWLSHDEKNNVNGINIKLWPANNCRQSWSLFHNHGRVRNNMSWTEAEKIKVNDSTELDICTKFHVKLYDTHGNYVMHVAPPANIFGTDRAAICEKLCNPLNGKWYRESWDDLKNFLEENGLIESPEDFTEQFDEKFEKSNRKCLNVSVGFEIIIHMPMKLLEECDKHNSKFMDNPENDAVAKLIVSALAALKSMIEE